MNPTELLDKLKGLILSIRNDPENLTAVRTMTLGFILCGCAYFAGTSIFVDPHRKILDKVLEEKNVLLLSNPELVDNSLEISLPELDKKIANLKEELGLNWVKKKVLNEQGQVLNDPELFNKTILTLSPAAPVSMKDSIVKVSNLVPKVQETFTMYPVSVEGNADFPDFFDYLRYLENRPEISHIDEIAIEGLPDNAARDETRIHFVMVIGRNAL